MTPPAGPTIEASTPLTSAEFGVWLGSRDRVETFNIHWAWECDSHLDVGVLREAVADLLRCNAALHRVLEVVEGTPRWRSRPTLRPDVETLSVAGDSAAWLAREGRHRFNLGAESPLRVRLVQCGDGSELLSVLAHHIAVDGRAMESVVEQVGRAYTARIVGRFEMVISGSPLPATTLVRNDDYWTGQLRGAEWPDVLDPGVGREKCVGHQVVAPLGPNEVDHIRRSARECRSSPQLLGLAALALTLRQYGTDRDVMVATPYAHRSTEDNDVIACRAQMLPVRQRWDVSTTGNELLRSLRRTVGLAMVHAESPMTAAADLFGNASSGQTVSFQILDPQPDVEFADVRLRPVVGMFNGTARFDLEFDLVLEGSAPALVLTYRAAAGSDREQYLGLCRNLAAALRALGRNPTTAVSNLDPLDQRAKTPVLRGSTGSATLPSWLQLLEQRLVATPAAPALQCGDDVVSFTELARRVDDRAGRLVDAGLRRGDRLAVLLPRGIEQVIMIHAAWRCGLCIVPFDLAEPVERLRSMLREAAVAAVTTTPDAADVVGDIVVVLDLAGPLAGGPAVSSPTPGLDDPAYLLYTSGTTGRPKGVLADHGNLAAFVSAQLETSSATRVGLTASIAFDVYLAQLVHLLRGACVVIAEDDTYRNPQRLASWARTHEVRYLDLTVSMARAASPFGLDAYLADGIEWLELGGEPVDAATWEWLRLHDVPGENGYGPTETTITATTAAFAAYAAPTIGVPVRGTWVYVVGPEGRPAPLGSAGELVIGGSLVTRGYPHAARLTADRFVPDVHALTPGGRAYRTGDRVRCRPDGALDFVGRVDEQLKIRGHRVDPFEVEDVLRRMSGVQQVHVARQAGAGADGVVAYIVATDELDDRTLIRLAAQSLPSAAVPRELVRVAVLPMNVHGKIDEAALPLRVAGPSPHANFGDEPLLEAWRSQLGALPNGEDDNFFELGGTSLSAAALVASLNQRSDRAVDLADFFSTPTVAGLRHALARAAGRGTAAAGAATLEITPAQQRLWLAHELEPDSDEFTVPWGVVADDAVDRDEVSRRWQKMSGRHAALRLRVERGAAGPTARLCAPDALPLTWSRGTASDLAVAIKRAAHRRFDPTRDPLIELHVVSLNDGRTGFVFVGHHLVVDQTSIAIIEDEIVRGIVHEPRGVGTASIDDSTADRAFWIEELAGEWDTPWQGLGIPAKTRTHVGRAVRRALDPGGWTDVIASVRRRRTTLLAHLAAAVWAVGERHTGTDVVVGTTMDCRRPGEESLVGLHVNPVAVRIRPDPWVDADALVEHATAVLRRVHAHRRLPFDEVVRLAAQPPSRTSTPLFQVLLDVQPAAASDRIDADQHVAKYDLAVTLSEDGTLVLTYRIDRFSATAADALADQLVLAVRTLAPGTAEPVRLLPLLDGERAQRLATGEHGEQLLTGTPLLPELLGRHAGRTPDLPAVTSNGVTLSWATFWSAAVGVAADLQAVGAKPGDLVVVREPRSAAMVVGAAGVMLSGAGYVSIDSTLPDQRWRETAAAVRPAAVVSSTPLPNGLLDAAVPRVVLRTDPSRLAPIVPTVAAHDPAYVIHTSGTTGRPKAVVVDHARLAFSTASRSQVYPGRATFLLVSSLSFDSSVAGLWGTLAEGGHVVVASDDEVRDPERLLAMMEAGGVQRMLCVPSLYENLLTVVERTGAFPPTLRDVVLAGDMVPTSLPGRHFALSSAPLVNEYGPTEASVWCTYRWLDGPGPVDIGGPIPGVTVRLLDDWGRRVPPGAPGEICVSGPGVTDGYRGRPGATAAAFVPDPWGPAGGRLYRTGDFGRHRDDGRIEFLGRRDDMVKIRGHRVELESIDDALRACTGVRDAAAVVMSSQLSAAVTGGPKLDLDDVRRSLRARLPAPLVPSPVVAVDDIPRNANGKLDRSAVCEHLAAATVRQMARPALDANSRDVAQAWSEVLGRADFAPATNFFEAGGHSLAVPRLQDALSRLTGVRPSLVDLFTAVTLEAQVELVARARREPDRPPAPPSVTTPSVSSGISTPATRRQRLIEARRRNAGSQTWGENT